jgi:hypothetical protein
MCPASSAGQVTPCYKGAHLLVRQKCPSANSPRSLAVARGHPDDEPQEGVFFFLVFVFVFVLARGKLTHKKNKHPLFAVFVVNSTQQQRCL